MTLTYSEKKFYEAFDIPKFWYKKDNDYSHYNSYNEMIKSWMESNDWSRSEAIDEAKNIAYSAYPPITDHVLLELEDIASKTVWYLGDSLIYEVDKKHNKAEEFRYRYYAREYSDRLIEESSTKKESLLKLLYNSHLKDRVYHEVRKIMGVE